MGKRNKFKAYLPFAVNVFQRQLSYKANVIILYLEILLCLLLPTIYGKGYMEVLQKV